MTSTVTYIMADRDNGRNTQERHDRQADKKNVHTYIPNLKL